jgi:hypothetical protein
MAKDKDNPAEKARVQVSLMAKDNPPCLSIQSEAADVDHGTDSDSVIVYAAIIDICQSELL